MTPKINKKKKSKLFGGTLGGGYAFAAVDGQ